MISSELTDLIIGSTRLACFAYSVALPPNRSWDNYSHNVFLDLPPQISGNEFTRYIGEQIYLKLSRKLSPPADFKDCLTQIIDYFVENHYAERIWIDWRMFSDLEWKSRGRSRFILHMVKPEILVSAQKLFLERGFAQHYLSRTLQAALYYQRILGKEADSFTPYQNSKDIQEIWEIETIK